jgi:hypothetical protein
MRLLGKLYNPHLGFMLLSYPPGEPEAIHLSPYETALAINWVGLMHVVPVHYVTGSGNPEMFRKYASNLASAWSISILNPGEEYYFEFDPVELFPTEEHSKIPRAIPGDLQLKRMPA